MKKVLILAYDFPPYNSIGGQRPYSWLLYLREFGIEPVVVTRQWDVEINGPEDCYLPSLNREVTTKHTEHGTIIRAPFTPLLRDRLITQPGALTGAVRKMLTAWQMVTEHSLPSSDSRRPIYDAARKYLKEHTVDLVIATGEPFILFTHAYRLGQEFNIPWAADYRDGWSTNLHLQENGLQRWIQKNIHLPIEKKMVSTASLITTAAPSFAEEISSLLGGKKVYVVYNGFFEEKFKGLENIKQKEKLTIAHAGTVYPYQKVETMIFGLRHFIDANPEIEVELIFYGLNFQPDQLARVRKLATELPVSFSDRMAHDDMIRELASCHALLLLATPEKQQIYAKVFDYLALGLPILLVENDNGPLLKILNRHEGAHICNDSQDVVKSLLSVSRSGQKSNGIPSSEFTRRHQTKELSNLIHAFLGSD